MFHFNDKQVHHNNFGKKDKSEHILLNTSFPRETSPFTSAGEYVNHQNMVILFPQHEFSYVPADAAMRLRVWAHLLQGQTLDSRLVGESGRYLQRSGEPQTRRKEGREQWEQEEEREEESRKWKR